MLKTIKKLTEWQLMPKLETNESDYKTTVKLFGKDFKIMDDYWMKHVHIKITDACNAKCPFCVEKGSCVKANKEKLMDNTRELLNQLAAQGHLTTVSITGGEPSICNYTGEVVDMIKLEHPDVFLTINTNLSDVVYSAEDFDWINISRHKVGNDELCGFKCDSDKDNIEFYKKHHPKTKFRMQCVLHNDGIKSIEAFDEYVDAYSKIADDLSFRRLCDAEAKEDDIYNKIRLYLLSLAENGKAELIEQVLKDYYVYETWSYKGVQITFSHSNMPFLAEVEKTESDNVLREIIVHPDGLISGSWYRSKKVIIK